MHKIVVPEALKAIAGERNFFIYQMPMKIPVALGKVDRARNTDEVAVSTLWEVVEKLDYLNRKPEVLERINGRRAEWASKEGLEPRLIDGFCVGYVPREDSAGVVVDLDKCVVDGVEGVVFDDLGLWEAVEAYRDAGGYWEVSPSGTGLRVVLPRVEMADELRSDRREAGGVAFQAAQEKAKGFTLTLSGDGAWQRGDEGDRLVDEVVRVRDEAMLQRRTERVLRADSVEAGDMALEWAHVSLEDLEGMLAVIPNEGPQKSERGWFVGMTKAIREVFEPRGLGEAAWDAWDAWVGSREDGGYDYEWNRRVWDEPLSGRSGEMSLAGLIGEARETGWRGSWELKSEDEGDKREKGFDLELEGEGRGESEEVDWNDPEQRFALIGGEYFDRWLNCWSNAVLAYRVTRDWDMKWVGPKGVKPVGSKASDRQSWLNQRIPMWDATDFWPGKGETYVRRDGKRILNTYLPLPPLVGGEGGDAKLWREQIEMSYGEDCEMLYDWMAWVMQNPGKKVGFALALYSEHEGAGKDFLLYPLMKYLGGYAGTSQLHQLGDEKNAGLLLRKLVLTVQEGSEGRFHDKVNMAERLKPLIAAPPDTLTVREMRKDFYEVQNVLNMVFLLNHKDALYIDPQSRRYYPIVTDFGGQWGEDKAAKAEWWKPRWDWLKEGDGEGWKEVAQWLLDRRVESIHERMEAPVGRWTKDIIQGGLPEGAGVEWLEDYLTGRDWVSLRQIRLDGFGVDGVPDGQKLVRVLKTLGFRKVEMGSDRGRLPVRVGPLVEQHVIMSRGNVTLDKDMCVEALQAEDVSKRDLLQRATHLKAV